MLTSGNYTWLKRYLSRFFTVVVVDEYLTSQLCPKCFKQLDLHGTKGVRVKECNYDCKRNQTEAEKKSGDEPGKFVVNRDFSAAHNFVTIVLCYMIHGKRPDQFTPNN